MSRNMEDLLSHDPLTGTNTWFHFDDATGVITLEAEGEVGDTTDFSKALYNEFDERARFTSDVHNHVATIPDFLYYQLNNQFFTESGGDAAEVKKRWKAWLNDSDNKAFRTRPGRV
jgi:hypothetical protein